MDSVPLNKIIFFCSYGCFPTSMLMLDHTTSLPWLNAIGKSLCCFRKSIACKILALYWFSWFSDCGKLVPMALIQLSSSIQWSQNQTSYSPHNLTLLKNKSDTQPVKKKLWKYHFSLLFRAKSGYGSVEAVVFTYNLNSFTTWTLLAQSWCLNVGSWMS